MLEAPLRHAAAALLESAISIAPPEVRAWGEAMRGELDYVESAWSALMWALGSASVLVRRALRSLLLPGRSGQMAPDGGLFTRKVSLRKVALAAGIACVLAALIFFAAPPFRQGLRVSLAAWNHLFHVAEWQGQPRLEGLARKAEAQRDPEGMVFVAVRLNDPAESARLAEEAVRLDSGLVWAYAVVAVRRPAPAEVHAWLPELERSDPANALVKLIEVQSLDVERAAQGHHTTLRVDARPPSPRDGRSRTADLSQPPPEPRPRPPLECQEEEDSPAWQNAMAAAFASPRFDDYLDRLRELDRRVVARYAFSDPAAMLDGEGAGLPLFGYADSDRFARSVIERGRKLEAAGDRTGAAEKYWSVARFGQLIDLHGHTGQELATGAELQTMAYQRLQALARKDGKPAEAALFGYLLTKFDPHRTFYSWYAENYAFRTDTALRNAAVLQISSLLMILFCGLMLASASILIARRSSLRPPAQRWTAAAAITAVTSAAGLLLSSATLYVTYRPYWYIFQRAVQNGDTSQSRDLGAFLAATHALPGVREGGGLFYYNLPIYFWTGVILLGVIGLIFILARHLLDRPQAPQLQPSPRVP